jgi:hypothetical protein
VSVAAVSRQAAPYAAALCRITGHFPQNPFRGCAPWSLFLKYFKINILKFQKKSKRIP